MTNRAIPKSNTAAEPVRTLFVSDVHLGSKHAQAKRCLEFLRSYQPERVYLVGDFIDGWRTHHGWHWNDQCTDVMDHIEGWMSQGAEVFYAPGNHDAFLRQANGHDLILEKFAGKFAGVQIADEFVFETIHGWRFLVTHGDLFDVVETQAQWISKATSVAYDTVLSFNRSFNQVIRRSDKNPYGACAALKSQVKRAIRFVSGFESSIMQHAQTKGCDGVICGHIHTPNIVHKPDLLYCNTGDWVENCTGLIEHTDGRICLESVYGKPRSLELPPHERDHSERLLSERERPSIQRHSSKSQATLEDDLVHAAGS